MSTSLAGPATNPVQRFAKRLEQDVDWLRAEGLETFHLYAFATLRQFGSAAELAGSLCEWLAERGESRRRMSPPTGTRSHPTRSRPSFSSRG